MATVITIAVILMLVALVFAYIIKKRKVARKTGSPACIGRASCSKCTRCSSESGCGKVCGDGKEDNKQV